MFTAMFLATAALVLVAAYLIFRHVRRDYLQHGRLTPLGAVLQAIVFGLHAWLVYMIYLNSGWPEVHCSTLCLVLGIIIGILGLGILGAGVGVFASFLRMLGREVNVLKRSGIYRRTRNPQLVGYGVFLLAFLLLWYSWHMIVAILVYAAITHMMVLTEEEHLRRVFGEEYARYCERVPRYIGLPRREGR
jgi:protein-S-isoprenylcysteine O-methyltransferase Ste14